MSKKMEVVTKQPNEKKQDHPSSYRELPHQSTGGHPSGYPTVYRQPLGTQQEGAAPVAMQPRWMPMPTNISFNCPPGLEYLTVVDQMLVDQEVELFEIVTDIDLATKFKIVNGLNQQVYFAGEESECCERICFKNARGFVMHIWDNSGREVMRVNRPFQFHAGLCWCADIDCCSLHIEVEAPVGQVIGRVKQTQSFWSAHYDVTSPDDDVLLKIRGPTCVWRAPCCTEDQDFNIYTPDLKENIGKISKKWGGLARELFTTAAKFGISFPVDLDVKMKATLFGALFLIDFMFFQSRK